MKQEEFVNHYLEFKPACLERDIINLEEIKLLFEVWLNQMELK